MNKLLIGLIAFISSVSMHYRHGLKDDGKYCKIDNLHLRYDGNRLVEVTEDADPVTREGATDFDYAGGTSHIYKYDSSGKLIQDLNRGIKEVAYDRRNNPREISFQNWKSTEYAYDGGGQRLRTVHCTPLGSLSNPMIKPRWMRRDTVDYSGPVVYENGKVSRVLFDGGYATFTAAGTPLWHYFVTDHLGSIRAVIDMTGKAEQVTHYYCRHGDRWIWSNMWIL